MNGRLTHTFSERRLRSFAGIVFRAIALQAWELADTPNGFAGTSFAAIRDSASYVFRSMPYSRQPLRGHFGFAGHPLPRPWVEWMGVSIEMVSPLGTKLALI